MKGSGRNKKSKSESKEAKPASPQGTRSENTKKMARSSPSVTAPMTTTTIPPMRSADSPPFPLSAKPVHESPRSPESAFQGTHLQFGMDLSNSTHDSNAATSFSPYGMTDNFAKMHTSGHESQSTIEHWLVASPTLPNLPTEMDMCFWSNDVVDPAVFSAMPSPMLGDAITSHASMMMDVQSSPRSGTLPSLTEGRSPQSGSEKSSEAGSKEEISTAKGKRNRAETWPNPPIENIGPASLSLHDPCQCLQQVVFLIDELESAQQSAARQLDAGLASHREALRYGEAMMGCGYCTTRPENMTILTFLTDRLAGLCERIVDGYLEMAPCRGNRHPPYRVGAGTGVFFGDYEVDSANEWETLVRNLIILQLRGLNGLMGRVKEVSGMMQCDTPWRKAVGTEHRVVTLLDKLGAPVACQ